MNKFKKFMAVAIMMALFGGATGCELISKTPEAQKKTVVAKVNGETITKGYFDKRWESNLAQLSAIYGSAVLESKEFQAQIKDQKLDLLDIMVNQTLIVQKAKELKIVPDDKKLNEEVDQRVKEMTTMIGSKENFEKYLGEMKLTEDEYRELLKTQVILDETHAAITKDVVVTDEDAKAYYNANIYNYTKEPNTMRVAHILVSDLELAKKIRKEYEEGAKFEDLAKKYGTDGTKDVGGDLGVIEYNSQQYDKQFLMAAIAVPNGEVSQPVHTQFGYHLIKVTDKKEYPVKDFETVKAEIKASLLEEKQDSAFQTKLDEWKKASKIKIYEDRI